MALIKCPDCGSTVSDKTITCLKCGRPIANTVEPLNASKVPVQTIEKTSKTLKGWMAASYAAFFGSLFIMFTGGVLDSTAIIVIGFLLFMVAVTGIVWTKARIWYEHG